MDDAKSIKNITRFDRDGRSVNYTNCVREYTDEEFDEHFEGYQNFTQMRSSVIDAALKIENALTVVILHFLVKDDYSRHGLLRALIFETESCSFMQKRKMLSAMFEMVGDEITCLPKSDAKELRRDINAIILIRDMMAHGVIYYDGASESFVIRYFRGKQTESPLADKLYDEFLVLCNRVDNRLTTLNQFFRENRVDYSPW